MLQLVHPGFRNSEMSQVNNQSIAQIEATNQDRISHRAEESTATAAKLEFGKKKKRIKEKKL